MLILKRQHYLLSVLALVIMSVTSISQVAAYEFRQFKLIGPPEIKLKEGAKLASEMNLNLPPISGEAIDKAVREFFAAWNSGGVDVMLAPEFVDKDRLLDAIQDTVPRDATIRVMGIQSASHLQAQDVIEELPDGQGFDRVATITATVDAQIEFTFNGFQTIRGVNTYTFRVREEYR